MSCLSYVQISQNDGHFSLIVLCSSYRITDVCRVKYDDAPMFNNWIPIMIEYESREKICRRCHRNSYNTICGDESKNI